MSHRVWPRYPHASRNEVLQIDGPSSKGNSHRFGWQSRLPASETTCLESNDDTPILQLETKPTTQHNPPYPVLPSTSSSSDEPTLSQHGCVNQNSNQSWHTRAKNYLHSELQPTAARHGSCPARPTARPKNIRRHERTIVSPTSRCITAPQPLSPMMAASEAISASGPGASEP
jgi:hypothetical protein